jgi:alpha-L-rhamnosidase
MDIAHKMATMLDAVKMTEEADFAKKEAMAYKSAIRDSLVDQNTLLVEGNCQTSQAMALHYGVFEEAEKETAFQRLLEFIHDAGDHIDVGVLGGRVLFHVLSAFGHSDLAFRMITREDYPSYGNWIKRGATTLWENFLPDGVSSMNHHFCAEISDWFIKCLAGIRIAGNDSVVIRPCFVKGLDNVSAYHVTPVGKVSVSWHRNGNAILLDVEIPDGMDATASLEAGYHFTNVAEGNLLTSGRYVIKGRIEDLS